MDAICSPIRWPAWPATGPAAAMPDATVASVTAVVTNEMQQLGMGNSGWSFNPALTASSLAPGTGSPVEVGIQVPYKNLTLTGIQQLTSSLSLPWPQNLSARCRWPKRGHR